MEQAYDPRTARLLENWPVLHIFKAGRQSFQASKVLLAAGALLVTLTGGGLLDLIWTSCGGGYTGQELRTSTPALILDYQHIEDQQRVGLFFALRQHTAHCVTQALRAAAGLNLTAGAGVIRDQLNSGAAGVARPQAGAGYGALAFLVALLSGWFWVVRHHWFFAVLCASLLLLVWSAAGGAICRIATVRFARDEFLSAREAVRFALRHLWSFFLAPSVLVLIMLLMGLAVILGTLILNGLTQITWLAWLGWPAIGLLFVLSLAAGTIIALIAFGLLGGSHLMWPTVAAEGSDFTDAISRSGYFLQAIERAIGYGVCAMVYGGLAWTVVRGVGWLALWTTHSFIELGLADLTKLWATPTFDAFYARPNVTLDGWLAGSLAPFMIRAWVGLFSMVVGGYLVSYYFTSSTIIYHLLRRAVDETELDDIYVEGGSEGEADDEAVSSSSSSSSSSSFAGQSTEPGSPKPDETSTSGKSGDSCVAP